MTIFFQFYTFEKISYYHSHGKPVIMTNCSKFRQLIFFLLNSVNEKKKQFTEFRY